MPEPTVNDRLRAASSRVGGTAFARKEQEQKKIAVQTEQEVSVATDAAIELHVKENPFYKSLIDTQATEEEKITQIADALDPKKQPVEKLSENFKLFQQYYTYVQSQELDEALENIKRLMRELESNTKVEIANILKNLKGMLDDVKESRDLVEVLRQSRINGKTVEEMTAAVERNEQVVKALADFANKKAALEAQAKIAQAAVDARITERNEKESTLSHRLISIVKRDSTYADRVVAAESVAKSRTDAVGQVDAKLAELTAARNKDLETGPLRILRSIDEVDDNLSQRLISSGRKGIDTIQGAQKSVLQLMQRTLFSEGEVDKIARRVGDKQIGLTILKSGLAEASKNTNEFKEGLEKTSADSEAALAAAKSTGSVLATAKAETAAIGVRSNIGDIIDYQGRLNDTLAEMNVTLSKNIERQGETDRQKSIVQGTKKSITLLGRDTLNTVAGNLEGVLHNLVSDQTDETQQAIVALSQAAENVKHGSMESMIERGKEMHNKDMSLLDDTIGRLNSSSEMIAKTLETAVDEGIARADKQRELSAAAAQLETATTTMRTVVGKMSNESVQEKRAS